MSAFVACAIAVLAYMVGWFIASLVLRRNDIADVAWGPGFILSAGVSLAVGGAYSPRGLLLSALVAVWGTRLAVHIHARNRGRGEDPRYRAWREQWGRWFLPRSFLQVFMLQGALLVLVASPVVFVNAARSSPLGALDALGGAVWLCGFIFEAVGDRQLLRFLRDPANRGRLMTEGLWRYSRHPNYFGEVTLWWGIWLIALSVPGGWATALGPLTITGLIQKCRAYPCWNGATPGDPISRRTVGGPARSSRCRPGGSDVRIAVIGGGISGLASAHLLCRAHEVTVFEANDYPGGHTQTHDVPLGGRSWAVDTGFIVFNERTYPNFIRLLARLGVPSQRTEMSFSVVDQRNGLQYRSTNLNTLFAQRRNLLSPPFWRLLLEIFRFNRESAAL